jgi:CheY-like chemotaxis protein
VNLLSNAVKFTPARGQVGLEVSGDRSNQTVTFLVWDTGIGIAEDDIPHLFQPFMQVDSSLSRQYEGTGLGLALVLQLVKAHGGSVAIESKLGVGSRFSVTLPWMTEQRQHQDEAQPHPATLLLKPTPIRIAGAPSPVILLAEDHEQNVELFSGYLELHGCRVVVARNGQEAITQASAIHPNLILMDIHMPGIDGIEATRRIRTNNALLHLPIIALTALAMPGDRERCLQAGANAYLTKPVNLHNLLSMIDAYLKSPN